MKESKASAAILCLFWGKPLQEKHEPAAKTAATVIQGLGKVSCDERWKRLQLHGQERFETSQSWHFPNAQKALTRGKLWTSCLWGIGCGIRAVLVRHLKGLNIKISKHWNRLPVTRRTLTNVCTSGLDLVGPAVGHEDRLDDVSRFFQAYFL